MKSLRWKRMAGAEFSRFGDELVLLDPSGRVLRGLNSTAAFIWERLEDEPTSQELAHALSQRFSVRQEQALADVQVFLSRCRDAGLVQSRPDDETTEADT